MSNQISQPAIPKVHLWRYLPILILTGLAVHLVLPQLATLEHSWSVVRNFTWWAVILAAAAQILSYLGAGYILHAILAIHRQRLSVTRGALISMASYSIGLVAGGWITGAAASYRWIRQESRDGNIAAMAGTLPGLLNNFVLMVVAIISTSYLLAVHDLKKLQLIEFLIILLLLGSMSAGVILALRFPQPTTRLVVWAAGRWARLRQKPYDPLGVARSFERLVLVWNSLGSGKWIRPVLGAVANIGFDILTLSFMFLAAGYSISPGILLAGYGLPLILGRMAFIFPGGVGVIEGSMVALYNSLGIPNAISVVVILGYRLLSFWFPVLLGFPSAAYLGGKRRRENNHQTEVLP